VIDGINLEKAGFSLVPGVMDPHCDMLFQEVSWFGTAFPREDELFPVPFQEPVDGLPRESGFLGLSAGAWP
jgi:hypothetical protein